MIFTGRTEHFIVKTCNNGSNLMVRHKDKVVTIHSKNFREGNPKIREDDPNFRGDLR